MGQEQLSGLVQAVGEPVTIYYEPRNEGMEWLVALERVPMIHEHFADLEEGLRWLAEHRGEFPEWEKQIARVSRGGSQPRMPRPLEDRGKPR